MSFQQNQGPDFDQEIRKFFESFRRNFKGIGIAILAVFLIVMARATIYTVEPDEEAIVIRLGKYQETTSPGLHFKIPFIEIVEKIKTTIVHQAEFGFRTKRTTYRRTQYSDDTFDNESLMVTGDLNVADVQWVVQYKISDPFKYKFQTRDPERNIRDISESIMRRVVGDRLVTDVLTIGRVEIASKAKVHMQEVLDRYDMGISIQTVKLQDVNPPESVKASFNEVNEAKQEQEKVINQAERRYNEVIPEARGKADKLIQTAEGYGMALINRSKGDAAKFLSVLKEYKRAPLITRKRLYLETMEEIFARMENITIVDSEVKGLMPVFGNMKGATSEK
ncbi:MAG: FtsH protease activity modulator HflK [Epsilonproteobacteria bacterium]|nr:MAG: FtsH protease activity modulator HflK [Campylobacterota bacterium]RLA66486.1 MAG: FtsH protease activity modulator HflK [Campylobacterota bacterium]